MPPPAVHRSIDFTSADGTDLVGDLAVPSACRAAAIICHPHPHPQYGGDRHNAVVAALFEALPPVGIAALRFDFRTTFDDGRGETLDATAALHELAGDVPDVPLIAVGYSFGGAIALALDEFNPPDQSRPRRRASTAGSLRWALPRVLCPDAAPLRAVS